MACPRDRTKGVRLRIYDGRRVDPPGLATATPAGCGRGPAVAPAPPAGAADGHPKIIGTADKFPLEARVWHRRPPDACDAIYHPSGVWLSVRVL